MKWDKVFSSGMAICGGIGGYLLGGWDIALKTFIVFMAIDYILGVICGVAEKNLSSGTAFKGILKKMAILCVITVAVSIDNITNADGFIRGLALFFYIGQEGISILENAVKLGVDVPPWLKDALIQLREGNKKEYKGE